MSEQDLPLNRLVEELKKLPSIGAKTAQRIAFYLIGLPQEGTKNLAEAIKDAKKSTFYCSTCYSMTHVDPCQYCSDPDRNDKNLCIVEEPFNISSIEKTGIYGGRYHVLLGTLSPDHWVIAQYRRVHGDHIKTATKLFRQFLRQFLEAVACKYLQACHLTPPMVCPYVVRQKVRIHRVCVLTDIGCLNEKLRPLYSAGVSNQVTLNYK